MGLHWAFSLLGKSSFTLTSSDFASIHPDHDLSFAFLDRSGFVSLALCALPFLFYWKGPSIRSHSKFVA